MVHEGLKESNAEVMSEETPLVRTSKRRGTKKSKRIFQVMTGGMRKGLRVLVRGRKRNRKHYSRNHQSSNSALEESNIENALGRQSNRNINSRAITSRRALEDGLLEEEDILAVSDANGLDAIQSQVLSGAELFLRHLFILTGVYLLGTKEYISPSSVLQASYVIGIAWSTCAFIRLSSWLLSETPPRSEMYDASTRGSPEVEPRSLFNEEVGGSINTEECTNRSIDVTGGGNVSILSSPGQHSPSKNGERKTMKQITSKTNAGESTNYDNLKCQHHPELENLVIFDRADRSNPKRVAVGEITAVDNEFWTGKYLLMYRTSDADEKVKPAFTGGDEVNDKASDYFRSKQRRFEMQIQLRFKKSPPSQLYFGASLETPIKLGMVQKAFVRATLNFIGKKNAGGFIYNVPGKEPTEEELASQMYEKPHLTFAVEKAFDRLVETKEGEIPPQLGSEIFEDPDVIKSRKKSTDVFSYNTTSTYTFCLWSAYGDFVKWSCVNLPAIRPFPFASIIGEQHVSIEIYYLNKPEEESRHLVSQKVLIADFEKSHRKYCKESDCLKEWIKNRQSQNQVHLREIESNEIDKDDGSESDESDSEQELSDSEESLSDDDENEEISGDEDEETKALEELGEGIYLKYGERIELREIITKDVLTNGGGFATLQSSDNTATVVIERVNTRSKRVSGGSNFSSGSSLIKSGDIVMVKLVDQNKAFSYLSIYKGWWLKWTQRIPKQNCYFIIQTHDVEGSEETSVGFDSVDSKSIRLETQSSYLRIGGSFSLYSKKSRRQVGTRVKKSSTYGGRVLGLYKPGSMYVLDDIEPVSEEMPTKKQSMLQMMAPVKLCACVPSVVETDEERIIEKRGSLFQSIDNMSVDSAAWLELMHRSERKVFRVYAIRLTRFLMEDGGDDTEEESFLRLRTGKELTPLLRYGASSSTNQSPDFRGDSFDIDEVGENEDLISLDRMDSGSFSQNKFISVSKSNDASDLDSSVEGEAILQHEMKEQNDSFEADFYDDNAVPTSPSTSPRRRKKKTWIRHTTHGISKVAKGVGKGTMKAVTTTGKVVSHTVIGNTRHRRTYLRERTRRMNDNQKSRDHHKAVLKAIKSPRGKVKSFSTETPDTILVGQMKAPDQSCRNVSTILDNLSHSPSLQAKALLSSHLSTPSDVDMTFLGGGLAELGVDIQIQSEIRGEFIVARALWDSHWREEAAVILNSSVDFYSPLTKQPNLSLPYFDIQSVREVNSDMSPLPGYPLLAIETHWKCCYLAFKNNTKRSEFLSTLNKAIFDCTDERNIQEELEARMWQSVQNTADLSGESEKWATVLSSKKYRKRTILNSRRMPFDCDQFNMDSDEGVSVSELSSFVENLLQKALEFSLDHMMQNPKDFVKFLDQTSRLRTFPLKSLDRNEKETFCIYVNLYHCLLQHSLLLATPPPTKKKAALFMRTHCYEIDGDVFSLAEFESCLIRGNLSEPFYPKPPYYRIAKKSRVYRAYALQLVDPRLCFILNNGNSSHPRHVTVLNPNILDEQLSLMTRSFLNDRFHIDTSKKVLTLPKVCDVYRGDFNGDINEIIQFCLQYLDEEKQAVLLSLLENKSLYSFTVKYGQSADKFHSNLMLESYKGKIDFENQYSA